MDTPNHHPTSSTFCGEEYYSPDGSHTNANNDQTKEEIRIFTLNLPEVKLQQSTSNYEQLDHTWLRNNSKQDQIGSYACINCDPFIDFFPENIAPENPSASLKSRPTLTSNAVFSSDAKNSNKDDYRDITGADINLESDKLTNLEEEMFYESIENNDDNDRPTNNNNTDNDTNNHNNDTNDDNDTDDQPLLPASERGHFFSLESIASRSLPDIPNAVNDPLMENTSNSNHKINISLRIAGVLLGSFVIIVAAGILAALFFRGSLNQHTNGTFEENVSNESMLKTSTQTTSTLIPGSTVNASSFLNYSLLVGVISGTRSTFGNLNDQVSGLTVLGSELFVIRYRSAHLDVYSTNNLIRTRNLTIANSSSLGAIVASPRYNCIYISDVGLQVVYRYNLTDNVISHWSVDGTCYGLSVTSTHNVLVTLQNTNQIHEYTPGGSLLRKISLDDGIEYLWHSIQLPNGQFVVSAGMADCYSCAKIFTFNQVCIVDPGGSVYKCAGEKPGSGVGQFNTPTSLASDHLGNVLVADNYNNRVILLNPFLTVLGSITIPGHTLNAPYALHLDLLTRRLYIGEHRSSGRVFVLAV